MVSQERPQDPVEYLSNFLRKYKDGEEVDDVEKAAIAAAVAAAGAGAVAGVAAADGEGEGSDGETPGDAEEEVQEGKEEEGDVVAAEESTDMEVNGDEGGGQGDETVEVETGEPEETQETVEPEVAKEDSEPMEQEISQEEEAPAAAEEQDSPAEPEPEPSSDEPPPTEQNESAAAPAPAEDDDAPEPENTEDTLNTDLEQGYDALEDALDDQEATSASPFDPVKEEQAEATLLSSKLAEPGEDGDVNAFSGRNSTRDESGQSVLHFACTRPGGGSTIMAFLQNPSVNLAWRDQTLRTARDVASGLARNENIRVIDNYIVLLAQRGDLEAIEGLMVDGYEHIADVEDMNNVHIVEVAENAEHKEVAQLIRSAPEFRERVERVHRCVRSGDIDGVKSLVSQDKRVGYAMNPRTGRNALHVAVLCEEIGIVKWLAENCIEAVKRGDNLERTCLHLSMGVDKCEKIVRLLVRAGAKRVVKDLRDRQPSYYYVHKNEIGELQAEERAIVN